jgi:hypothetical protein
VKLSLDTALDIIAGNDQTPGMTDLKKFPQQPQALTSLALKLAEACKGPNPAAQLRWLVKECGTTMDEYPGPATLLDMLAKRFPAQGTMYAEYDLGPPPEPPTPEELAELNRGMAELAAKVGMPVPKPPKQVVMRSAPVEAHDAH